MHPLKQLISNSDLMESLAPKKYGHDLILPYIGSDLKEGMIPFCGVFLTGTLASIWLGMRKNKVQLAHNKKLPTN